MNHSCVSDVRVVAGALLAVLLGAGDAQAVSCWDGSPASSYETEHGFFVDPARKTALSLRPPPCDPSDDGCDHNCVLQHEDGPIAQAGSFDGGTMAGVCRDPVTVLDHALVHTTAGKYSEVQLWSVEPASGEVKREYDEAWYDSLEENPTLLVSADGRCLWRERQQARAVFQNALSALRVGQDATPLLSESDATALPVREIPAQVVRQQLLALDAVRPRMAAFGAAVYADEAGRAAWRVIQLAGTVFYDAPGVVLVEERRTGRWRALYDVISGGSYQLNYPVRFMIVAGDTLTAELCIDCSFWGEYGCFEIALPTHRVTSLNGAVCEKLRDLHYPDWDEYDPADEERTFDLRGELGMD